MTTFTVTGEIDPFLHVSLKKGDKIYCESGSMVMMEANLDLQGRMSGGLGQALIRRFANGESFFQQHIEATRGDGDCLLSPALPGAMEVVTVGEAQYILNDGAFVAATSDVALQVRTQSVGNALFGQSGGFFVMETAGKGQLVVSGFGSIFSLAVEPNKDLIIDNAHVVCWDKQLHYEISVTTGGNRQAGGLGGLLGNLVNSVASGEGMVLRFSGRGKVYICSRNPSSFAKLMAKAGVAGA